MMFLKLKRSVFSCIVLSVCLGSSGFLFSQANVWITEYVDWNTAGGVAIEIYNIGPDTILPNQLTLVRFNFTNTTPPPFPSPFGYPIPDTILPQATYIIGNSDYCSLPCVDTCDEVITHPGVNGNDVIALVDNWPCTVNDCNWLDMIGVPTFYVGTNTNSQTVDMVSDALYQHRLVRDSCNRTYYNEVDGNYNRNAAFTSWPGNSAINVFRWEVTPSACLERGFTPATGCADLLPVTLKYFQGDWEGCDQIRLAWASESESNHDRYELFVAKRGERFRKIETISAESPHSIGEQYEVTHSGMEPGDYQIQLRQVDLDGAANLLKTITVQVGEEPCWRLYPNPAREELFIEQFQSEGGLLSVFDAQGQVVLSKELAKGMNPINLHGWASGLYYYRFVGQSGERKVGSFQKL